MCKRSIILLGLVLAFTARGAAQDEGGGDYVTIKIDRDLGLKDLLDQVSKAVNKPILYDTEAASTAPAMEVIELEHARAELMADTLSSLMREPEEEKKTHAQRRASGTAPMKPRIVPYTPRNAVVVYASQADIQRIKGLVARLDRPVLQGAVK